MIWINAVLVGTYFVFVGIAIIVEKRIQDSK